MNQKVNRLFALWGCLLVGLTLVAQAADFGIKGGYMGREGFRAGIFTELKLNEHLSLQPELYFTQRKYEYQVVEYLPISSVMPTESTLYEDVKMLEIPVLLQYRFNQQGRLQPVFFGGGYIAVNLDKKEYMNVFTYNSDGSGWGTQTMGRKYKQTETGVVLGLGIRYALNKVTWLMDFRVNLALSSLQQMGKFLSDSPDDVYDADYGYLEDKKTRSISVMIGIMF